MIQVRIEFHADPSVGAFGYGFDMTIPWDPTQREDTRAKIKELYDYIDNENTCVVYFEDELKDTD